MEWSELKTDLVPYSYWDLDLKSKDKKELQVISGDVFVTIKEQLKTIVVPIQEKMKLNLLPNGKPLNQKGLAITPAVKIKEYLFDGYTGLSESKFNELLSDSQYRSRIMVSWFVHQSLVEDSNSGRFYKDYHRDIPFYITKIVNFLSINKTVVKELT